MSLFRNNSVFNRTISIRTKSNLSTPLRGGDSSKSIINERNKIMLSCMRWDTQIPPRSGFHAQPQRWTNRVRNQSPDEIWKMESSIFRPCSVSTFFVPNSTPNQEVQNHGRSILSTNQATKTKVGDDENPLLFSTGEVASSHTELSENSSLVREEFIRN